MELTHSSFTCVATDFGSCSGKVYNYSTNWICPQDCAEDAQAETADASSPSSPMPTKKPTYDNRIIMIMLCGAHFNKFCVHHDGQLPTLVGHNEEEVVDNLVSGLEYTGPIIHTCADCGYRQKKNLLESAECTTACGSSLGGHSCDCKEELECVCASFNNNEIHWAILTYANGFLYDTIYQCWSCVRPSWREEHTHYYKHLVDIKNIVSMAKKNPNGLRDQNFEGKNPTQLIDFVIEALMESTAEHNEYAKCREDGWARHNIDCLTKLKKELTEVLIADYVKKF